MGFGEIILNIIIIICLTSGLFFFFVGVVGLVRMPDVFTRMHATTKCDTMGPYVVRMRMRDNEFIYSDLIVDFKDQLFISTCIKKDVFITSKEESMAVWELPLPGSSNKVDILCDLLYLIIICKFHVC